MHALLSPYGGPKDFFPLKVGASARASHEMQRGRLIAGIIARTILCTDVSLALRPAVLRGSHRLRSTWAHLSSDSTRSSGRASDADHAHFEHLALATLQRVEAEAQELLSQSPEEAYGVEGISVDTEVWWEDALAKVRTEATARTPGHTDTTHPMATLGPTGSARTRRAGAETSGSGVKPCHRHCGNGA